jgi:hypothetical protein
MTGARSGGAVMSMCGLMPETGDAVLLGPPAGVDFRKPPFPAWFRVLKVAPAVDAPGWVHLTGWIARDIEEVAAPREVFCRVAGLVIRRQPYQLPHDRCSRTERQRCVVLAREAR